MILDPGLLVAHLAASVQASAGNARVRAWLDGAAGGVYIFLAIRMLTLERRPA
jgi:threonine/homoserine/homoserine lactone efflux protein